jgi:hypothetical protein
MFVYLSALAQPVAGTKDAEATARRGPKLRGDWPPLDPGVWKVTSRRTLPNGKVQNWEETLSRCVDTSELFMGYWGLGIVEEAGCRYQSVKIGQDQYSVTSECMIRRSGNVKSEATIKVKSPKEFEANVTVPEGKRLYRGNAVGTRISDCPAK